jgi:hypothetical protein
MALPPERLSELIPAAELIAVAEVVQILGLGPKVPPPAAALKAPKGATSVGYEASSQKVRLRIEHCLFGQAPSEGTIDVEKPVAPYTLRVGDKGPFFIGPNNVILGRYGPDTRPNVAEIEAALKTIKR